MTFEEVVDHAIAMLQRRGRLTYRMLQRHFQLDDAALEDLKEELLYGQRVAVEEEARVLVWSGEAASAGPWASGRPPMADGTQERVPLSYTPPYLADKILTSRSALEGEHKLVTVLFCDLADSTALAERLGPEPMHTLLNRFFALALGEVHRYEGTINQFLGDGFMALFGAPIAHEDHARRAVLAAVGVQRVLHEHQAELGGPHRVACQFRMGLHTGGVVVGGIGDNLRMDYTAVGDTTNLAARLQQVAEPGTILVSSATGRLVQGAFRLEVLPPVQVKGKAAPVAVYKVLGTSPRRSALAGRGEQTLNQFVGRGRELTLLEDLWTRVEEGHGQVVGIVGEAGQGKSRLLYEFRHRVAGKRLTYLEGRCLSYGRMMPYHPLIEVVRHHCEIAETDGPTAVHAKVRAALQEMGLDAEVSTPYLCWLLGVKAGTDALTVLTPEALKARLFVTLTQMHLRGRQRRPLLCTIEDLHWIDTTSEEYVATLVDRLREAAIMLVVTYRPDYCPPWVDRSHQIALGQLATHEAVTVVRSNSAHTALPEPVVEMIITKAEGNPFFLEELTRAVVAQAHFPAEGTVPDTIQGVLMARIDRLPEEAKRLLQTASVLGREFSLRLVQALWDSRGRPDPWLRELTRQEFLYQALGAAEPVYVFKHALTQDVAYTSLLTARRQALHAAAGRALEGLYADHLEEVYDRLAYHYAQTEEATKAVTYLTYVAEKALAQYARDAALTALQEAGRHAARLHGTARDHHVLDLVIRQGWVLEELGHAQEALDLLSQQQACVERLHEPVHTANYYQCLGFLYNRLGAWEPALQSAQRALAEASQGRNDAAVGRAHYLLMMLHAFIGQPRQGLVYGEQAMPLLEQTHEWYALGRVHFWFAFMAVRFGDFDRALQSAARAEALGATIGDRRLQCQAAQMAQLTYVTQGDWDRALTWGQRALELATGQRDTTWSTAVLGDTHLEQGNVATALTLLEQGALQWGYFQPRQTQGWFLAWLGEAYLAAGQFARAHELVLQGLAYTLDAKYWIGVGIAQRALGRVTRASGALPEAATHLHRALHTFTAHEYRPEQARTHLDLAAVAQAQGDVQAATTHLRAAQRLFTAMQAAAYVERTVQLAHAYAIPLAPESREQQPGSDPAR